MDLNEVFAAILFAIGAVVAFYKAIKEETVKRAAKVYTILGVGLAGLFALVIDAALGKP